MKDRREGKHGDEKGEKTKSGEAEEKAMGAGEEWHWGWTRRNGHPRTPAERADRWQHADKKTTATGRESKKKKKSERPLERRPGERGRRVSGEKKARRGGARLKCIDVREWDNTHTHTHTKDIALGTCWQGGRVSRGRAKHDCGQNKDVSSARGQEKHSGPAGGQTRTLPGWCRFNIFCRHLLLVFVLHSRTSAFSPLFTASHKKMTFVKTLLYLPGWGCHLSLTWERHRRS